ncbi:MAG: efflux RND transporter periplasmic adaptor subunit [Calditrichae bacterium]|nr:efflux RND transporter periplasmic adaptor subunit [Calditrichia bacterium]
MKRKIIIGAILLILLAAAGSASFGFFTKKAKTEYLFAEITRGNLESTISSTGTLSPVTTVEVGTQVSGTLAHIYADFNDEVRRGQLLAVIDTVNLKTSVLTAKADLNRAQAQLDKAISDYNRNKPLFEKGFLAESEFLQYDINLKTQRAALVSSEANLQRAEQNLKYAFIYSPINGTVIQRNVEQGQTVAASLSAPTLFEIAEDLSKMEILAEVDESDIGTIKIGLPVRFEVQAYPDKIFNGSVRQVRLKPAVVSNVVTYTVVIDAPNDDNLLLPGMTATVDFVVEQKNDVLLVPNAALRFQPSEAEMTAFRERRQKEMEALPDSVRERRSGRGDGGNRGGDFGGRGGNSARGGRSGSDFKQVWFIDDAGNLAMAMMRAGSTDGSNTEIARSRSLEEGMKVITGTSSGTTETSTRRQQSGGFGPPRRGF